jgi:hypothetical protein
MVHGHSCGVPDTVCRSSPALARRPFAPPECTTKFSASRNWRVQDSEGTQRVRRRSVCLLWDRGAHPRLASGMMCWTSALRSVAVGE